MARAAACRLRGAEGAERIQYRHAIFEEMEQPDDSVDMVYFQFMFHECPTAVIRANIAKAAAVVRPGGVVGLCDMNPFAVQLQKLPPVLKALREGTEPWLYQYERTDIPALFAEAGLDHVEKIPMDERHIAHFGRVPS
jgi:ubiquinone/menaquinone biosynthesis C-methylase UbiE